MHRIASMREDKGYTLVEVSIAAMLGMIVLGAMSAFLMNAINAGAFAQGQAATLSDARSVILDIEKQARGANSIDWCEPVGSCLEIDAQTPTGDFQQVRYVHADSELQRQRFDPEAGVWSDPITVIERVKNTAEQPVFSNSSCDEASITLQRVVVDLYIEPTPVSNPSLNIQTSFRPRNFPSVASCPGS
jgi:hypothetical protein